MTEDEERAAVVAEAKSWLLTPWHHRARLKGVGVDCAMLLAEVYHAAVPHRVPHIVPPPYPRDWHLHQDNPLFRDMVASFAHPVDEADWRVGDAVLFRFGRVHAHGGVKIADGLMIHAQLGTGVTTQETWAGWLQSRDPLYWSIWP